MHLRLARVNVADEGFQAVGGELDRAPQQHRERRNRQLVRIGRELHAEGAADVGRDHANLVQRQAELGREHLAHLERHLMRVMHGERREPCDRTPPRWHAARASRRSAGRRRSRARPRRRRRGMRYRRRRRANAWSRPRLLGIALLTRGASRAGCASIDRRRPGSSVQSISISSTASSASARLSATTATTASPCQQASSGARADLRRRHVPGQQREPRLPRLADGGEIVAGDDGDHAGRGFWPRSRAIASMRACACGLRRNAT